MKLEITIPGEPVAQGRPRFARMGKFVRTFDPEKSRSFKQYARACMFEAMTSIAPLPFKEGPLAVTILAVFTRPKASYSKREPKSREPKTTRPDTENVCKAVLDAATGILWHDDAQVTHLVATKLYGAQDEPPFISMTVEDLGVQSTQRQQQSSARNESKRPSKPPTAARSTLPTNEDPDL